MSLGIQSVSFTGGKSAATKYLERKAAQVEKDAAEAAKDAARLLINQNKKATNANQYIPAGAYFGVVPTTPRPIGQSKLIDSINITKTNVPELNASGKVDFEPAFNYFG